MRNITVAVVDGKGGGLGRSIVESVAALQLPMVRIVALGANSAATANMLSGGAHEGATGENAVCWMAARADLIAGPVAIILSNAMMGEITPRMARCVAESPARKALLPNRQCGVLVAGSTEQPMKDLVAELARLVRDEIALMRRSDSQNQA